jgi:hypothetical protein
MKKCFRCKEEKSFEFFCKNKRIGDGYSQQCKECSKEYHNKNRDLILERQKEYYNENKDIVKERQKEYRDDNKEIIKELGKEYYRKNREEISIKKSKYRDDNKESIKIQKREYYLNNKESIKVKHKEYKRIKRQDPLFRLKGNIRNLIGISIKTKGYLKKSNTEIILGCELKDFILYIESKFEIWMNWENYGKYNGELNYGWDIDHIIPLSSAKNEDDIYQLNHFSNLQPLCSYLNRVEKRGKLEYN